MNIFRVPTRKLVDVREAWCPTCKATIEPNPYWSLVKSVRLHESGTGHKVEMFAWEAFPDNKVEM